MFAVYPTRSSAPYNFIWFMHYAISHNYNYFYCWDKAIMISILWLYFMNDVAYWMCLCVNWMEDWISLFSICDLSQDRHQIVYCWIWICEYDISFVEMNIGLLKNYYGFNYINCSVFVCNYLSAVLLTRISLVVWSIWLACAGELIVWEIIR